MDRLQALNSGFDGKETHVLDDAGQVVTEMSFSTDKVTDMSPVRALARLKKLRCAGSPDHEAPVQRIIFSAAE